jgi:hypothetical protein
VWPAALGALTSGNDERGSPNGDIVASVITTAFEQGDSPSDGTEA